MRARWLLRLVAGLCSAQGLAQDIIVVTSEQPAFTEAARSAVDALGPSAQLLRADKTIESTIGSAKVTIAVGPLADRLVAQSHPRAVVSCLTPRSQNAGLLIPLRPSLSEVTGVARTALPDLRTIAVFGATDVPSLRAAATEAGLKLLTPESDEAFSDAVDRLAAAADALWIDDPAGLPASGALLIIKRASENKKPVIGSNRALVMQGALLAVVPDPVAQGKAAADVALRLQRGELVAEVSAPPGRIVINGAQMRTRGIRLPPAVARRTETVE
jgi:hypothetical protein